MKATQKDFPAIARRVAGEARVFYLCGPDEAGVQDGIASLVSLLPDPGERVELAGSELRRDPVRLGDEARSPSLFGDARHIVVRASGDDVAEAVELLVGGEGEHSPVLIAAPGGTDKGKVARLLVGRGDALVVVFWPPDARSVVANVREMAGSMGLRIDSPLAERIARAANHDTRIARSELAKLAQYLDASAEAPRTADAAAVDAIGASTEEDGMMPLVNTVLGGDLGRLAAELERLKRLELNPVGLLLAFERRAAQLAVLSARLGPRGDVRALLEAEKAARRIIFRDEADLAVQLRRWQGGRLDRLVSRLAALHRQLLGNSRDAELLLAQGLAEIARAAAAKN